MMGNFKEFFMEEIINKTNINFSRTSTTASYTTTTTTITSTIETSESNIKLWHNINLTDAINLTEINFSEDPGYMLRYGVTITTLLSIAYGLIFIVGVLGNIAVVLVVFNTTRMRSPTNQFIANLAIADLLVNVLCLPFTLIGNLFPAWILGEFFCKFVSYSQGVSVSASVNTLMAISIERCAAISFPLSGIMSKKQYKMVVGLIWLEALTINLPWLFVFTLEPIGIRGSHAVICIELWPSEESGNVFFIVANLTICYLGPLAVISYCYILIWRKVATRSVPGEEQVCNKRTEAVNRIKIKVLKMVFVVIITFALSWLPLYTIFCIVKFTDLLLNENVHKIIILFLPIAQWLGAANSCINPVLYAFMNNKFRIGFVNLIRKNRPRSTIATNHEFNNVNLKNYKSKINYKSKKNVIVKTELTRLSSSSPHHLDFGTNQHLTLDNDDEIVFKIRL